MKNLFLLFLILSFQTPQAQELDSELPKTPQQLFDYHTLKQKRNKTTAWILAGGGLLMTMSGLVINSADEAAEVATLGLADIEEVHKGDWLIYVGGATTLASIPFFISSGKHKSKATVTLKAQQNTVVWRTLSNSNSLAIGFKIDF
jgi:Ca2+/Na+ antiporter